MLACKRRYIAQFFMVLLSVFITACEQPKNEYIAPPPPEVTVSLPTQQDVTEYLSFTGTTQAVAAVDVKARVSGELLSIHFVSGVQVKKGDLLFIIDPEPYEAELAAAEAQLISAKAEFNRTQAELKRADQLIKKNFISKTDHLRRQTERDVAKAQIGLKESKVRSAKIQLSYTQVTAPISGRVSRNLVDVGNLVGDKEATSLTTITQYQPMYVYFHINERDLLKLMKMRREKAQALGIVRKQLSEKDLNIPLQLGLSDEQGFPHIGTLDFGESELNTSTGTMQLRGIFSNAAKPPRLLPGLFTRLRLPIANTKNALLINERAISADQSGRYLLIVDKDNKVEKRAVVTGQKIAGMVVIKEGINASDRVIVNGLQKARPGSAVNPQTAAKEG
ncbi:MAG: efflux RND transporter periplasmic adaptor subunit [Methyloprofundus sp.]|nr:efflux RND transporter periplasmic adaptor subunit [Methyloprofundus sp.]